MFRRTDDTHHAPRRLLLPVALLLTASLAAAQGNLRGTVVDENDQPVSGVEIQLVPGDEDLPTTKVKSNKKGKFVFGLIRPSDYRLLAFKDGMRIYRVDANLEVPGDESRWSFHKDMPAGSEMPSFKVDGSTTVTIDLKMKPARGKPGPYGTGEPSAGTQDLVELIQGGDAEVAIEEIARSLEDKPKSASLHYLMAFAKRAGGDLEGARGAIEETLDLEPDFEGAALLKARILEESGDHEAAIEWYVKESEQAQSFEVKRDAYIGLAMAYEQQEDLPKAIEVLEDLVDLAPDNTAALKELAQLYIRNGEQDKANELLKQVTMMGDADPNILYNLGAERYNAGDLDKAAEYFVQVVEMAPDFADAYLRLAFTRLGQGRKDEAVANLEKFLELATDDHPEKETARSIHAQLVQQ